jgi:hypothetical protein
MVSTRGGANGATAAVAAGEGTLKAEAAPDVEGAQGVNVDVTRHNFAQVLGAAGIGAGRGVGGGSGPARLVRGTPKDPPSSGGAWAFDPGHVTRWRSLCCCPLPGVSTVLVLRMGIECACALQRSMPHLRKRGTAHLHATIPMRPSRAPLTSMQRGCPRSRKPAQTQAWMLAQAHIYMHTHTHTHMYMHMLMHMHMLMRMRTNMYTYRP